MSVKTKLKLPERWEPNNSPYSAYPHLAQTSRGKVVLFTAPSVGIVIVSDSKEQPVGAYSTAWIESHFYRLPADAKITIKQK